MKRYILTFFLGLLTLAGSAQQNEQIGAENMSQGNDVFPTNGEWARVVIQTREECPLEFHSGVDISIDKSDTDIPELDIPKDVSALCYEEKVEDGVRIYSIRFRTGKKYSKRELTVTSVIGRAFVHIPLYNIEKKRTYRYRIYNPDDVEDITCYAGHKLKGDRYYEKFNYAAAKEEYLMASQCDETSTTAGDREKAKQMANSCEAILKLIEMGNSAAEIDKYDEATEHFEQALKYNEADDYLRNRYEYCARKQRNSLALYRSEAERSYQENDFETALEMYNEWIKRGGDSTIVMARINACKTGLRKRKNTEHYFGLEYDKSMWGFTVANYRQKGGSFFTLRINKELPRIMRRDYDINDIPAIDLSFGGNIALINDKVLRRQRHYVFRGLWMHLGVGALGGANYKVRDDVLRDYYWDECFDFNPPTDVTQEHVTQFLNHCKTKEYEDYTGVHDVLTPEFGIAAGAEIGLTVKIWRIALRGTYNFRVPIKNADKYKDTPGTQLFTFGLGFCW